MNRVYKKQLGGLISIIFMVLFFVGFNSGDNEGSETSVDFVVGDVSVQAMYGGLTVYLESYLYVNDSGLVVSLDDDPDEIQRRDEERFIALAKIHSLEGDVPSKDITGVKIYIFKDEEMLWESGPDEPIRVSPNMLTIVFRNGPSSLRFEVVDVVIEFLFDDKMIRLKEEGVYIFTVS